MATQQKRGFFSGLGFGYNEQMLAPTEEKQFVAEHRLVKLPVEPAASGDALNSAPSISVTALLADVPFVVPAHVQCCETPAPREP